MAAITLGTGLAIAGGAMAASAAAGVGTSLYAADQQRKAAREQERAQEEAQRKQQAAQEKAAREAAARTPAELKQRDFSTDATNTRLRGIQATMLASRKAQNADAGGKTHLGE